MPRPSAKGTVEEKLKNPPRPGREEAKDADTTKEAYIQFTLAKAKEKKHQAKLAEFKEKEQRELLVSARTVQREADKAARMVHDAFMSLPERVASVLVGADEHEIMEELRKEIRTILENLSREMQK